MIWIILKIVAGLGGIYYLCTFSTTSPETNNETYIEQKNEPKIETKNETNNAPNNESNNDTNNEKSRNQKGKRRRNRRVHKTPEVSYRPVQPKRDFLEREMLPVPNTRPGLGFSFTIMTYNVLAQALVKRLLYPYSGEVLRWKKRYDIIKQEIKYHNPTILCMQEVDVDQLENWRSFLLENGYSTNDFDQYGKRHCLLIAHKYDKVTCIGKYEEEYEDSFIEEIPQDEKRNGALVGIFRFTDEVCKMFPYLSAKGLLIGTTHLYWLPQGCFDRTLQCHRLLEIMNEVRNKYSKTGIEYVSLLAGDFNTEPQDAPYQLMTTKAQSSKETVVETLASSLLMSSQLPNETKLNPGHQIRQICRKAASDLVEGHDYLNSRAISLYSIAHGTKEQCQEPHFTNWTPNFKGTLDYIFALVPHQLGRLISMKNRTRTVIQKASIRPLKYLALPTADEMNQKDILGLPKLHYSPSDHFSIMVEVELIEHNYSR